MSPCATSPLSFVHTDKRGVYYRCFGSGRRAARNEIKGKLSVAVNRGGGAKTLVAGRDYRGPQNEQLESVCR